MKKISFNVREPYYSFLLSGQKTIEGRLNKGKFAELEVGDILLLAPEDVSFKVLAKRRYETFSHMLAEEGIKKIVPDKESIADAAAVYHPFYSPQDEKQFGVVAIELKRIDKID